MSDDPRAAEPRADAHDERSALDVDYRRHVHPGRLSRRGKVTIVAVIVLSVVLAAAAQLTLKYGMTQVGPIRGSALQNPGATIVRVVRQPAVWGGLVLFGLSAAFWMVVLSRVSLSFAYPFAALTYVIILGVDRFLLRESVPGLRWIGVLFIMTGIVLVSRTPHT